MFGKMRVIQKKWECPADELIWYNDRRQKGPDSKQRLPTSHKDTYPLHHITMTRNKEDAGGVTAHAHDNFSQRMIPMSNTRTTRIAYVMTRCLYILFRGQKKLDVSKELANKEGLGSFDIPSNHGFEGTRCLVYRTVRLVELEGE